MFLYIEIQIFYIFILSQISFISSSERDKCSHSGTGLISALRRNQMHMEMKYGLSCCFSVILKHIVTVTSQHFFFVCNNFLCKLCSLCRVLQHQSQTYLHRCCFGRISTCPLLQDLHPESHGNPHLHRSYWIREYLRLPKFTKNTIVVFLFCLLKYKYLIEHTKRFKISFRCHLTRHKRSLECHPSVND